MNSSKFRFMLDLHTSQSQVSIPITRGDTARAFYISLADGGLPYVIADGCFAKISIKRPGGTTLEFFCVIENHSTIVYDFNTDEQTRLTAQEEGIHQCQIELYDADDGVIGTPRFTMVVSERVINADDVTLSEDDYTYVNAMLSKEAERQTAEEARATAETQRQDAETTRATAETQRRTAEEARATKETERQAADIARGTAEAERREAETARDIAETNRQNAESKRITAEEERETAEEERKKTLVDVVATVEEHSSTLSEHSSQLAEHSDELNDLNVLVHDFEEEAQYARDNMKIEFSINPQTYVLEARLKNSNNLVISSTTVDLPLESFVVGASVSDDGDHLIISLQNGQTVSVSVANIVKGLATTAYVDRKVTEINDTLFVRVKTGKLTLDDTYNLTMTLYNEQPIKLSESTVALPLAAIIERIDALEARPVTGDNSTVGLAYELSADGTYYICTGIGTATDTDIIIANEYKGLPVKAIANRAFANIDNIRVYIPENIETIGAMAMHFVPRVIFSEHSKIQTLTDHALNQSCEGVLVLPKSLKTIGAQFGDPVYFPRVVVFKGTPNYIAGDFFDNPYIAEDVTDIYVPWSESHSLNNTAPWGCINAKIHYDAWKIITSITMDGFSDFKLTTSIMNDVDDIKAQIGDIDTALDTLLAKQSSVLGGA